MLRKKKSFNNLKGVADEKYILALRDRSLEEEKLRDYQKRHEVTARHLREEELKWQKSEIRAFDKKHLNFNEEKFEEVVPYETLDFDTLADVLALGTAQLNLQKVISIQNQCIDLYEEEFDILENCMEHAKEEKESLMKSFMSSINDSPFLLNTKRNFDNKIRHDKLKNKLSTVLLTITELKEKINEYNKILKLEKFELDDERKILFNKEVITEKSTLQILQPIYDRVNYDDQKLNEYMNTYNKYEKLRLPKEKLIEENSINRFALEFRAIYGGITGIDGVNGNPLSPNGGGLSGLDHHGPSGPSSQAQVPPGSVGFQNNSANQVLITGTQEVQDFDHLTEAVKVYEKELNEYLDLKEYCIAQEKALSCAVKHAQSEIKSLREARVLKSYGYYDEIAKQWTDVNAKIEKLRKNISNAINTINANDKKIATESNNMLKNFKAVTEGLPNKRKVYRFLHSDTYQSLLSTVKSPIQKAKELHELKNQETLKYANLKNERESLVENLLKNRDEVMETMNQAKKTYHKYQRSLETYDVTIKALDYGKMHGVEQLENALKLVTWLEDETKHLQFVLNLQKQEEELTLDSMKKIESLEERIESEKYQASYRTPFGAIMIGGGNGTIEELKPLRSILRDRNQSNNRTVKIQQIIDSRARLSLYTHLKPLCKFGPLRSTSGAFSATTSANHHNNTTGTTANNKFEFTEITVERKCVTKSKIVYQLEENTISIHKQVHLERARRVLPYSHPAGYSLVFLPYRGKISQSISAPIPVQTTNPSLSPSIPLPMEKIARRKSTSIEPGIVNKMKRTHSKLIRKGSTRNMFDEEDNHSESGITLGSQQSSLANTLLGGGSEKITASERAAAFTLASGHLGHSPEKSFGGGAGIAGIGMGSPGHNNNNTSDYSKEIQAIEAILQRLFKYEQELIADNQKVMADVSNLLQSPAGRRLLENKDEKWLEKVFFPENEFEAIVAKFELMGLLPAELRGKKLFPINLPTNDR